MPGLLESIFGNQQTSGPKFDRQIEDAMARNQLDNNGQPIQTSAGAREFAAGQPKPEAPRPEVGNVKDYEQSDFMKELYKSQGAGDESRDMPQMGGEESQMASLFGNGAGANQAGGGQLIQMIMQMLQSRGQQSEPGQQPTQNAVRG